MWELFLSFPILVVPLLVELAITLIRSRIITSRERSYSPDEMRTSSLVSINLITIVSAICCTASGVVGAVFAARYGANYLAMSCGVVSLVSVVSGTAFVITNVLSGERIEDGKLYAKRFVKTKEIPLEDIAYFYLDKEKNSALVLYDGDKKQLLFIYHYRLGKTMIARELEARGKIRIDNPKSGK